VRHSSFSIAEMMVIIAIFALDCLAARAASTPPTMPFLVLGGLPMQSALVIGLLVMFRLRGRMETPFPFLIGFEVAGWICLLMYVVLCFQTPQSIDMHLIDRLSPMLRATGFRRFSAPDWVIRVGLAVSYLTAPQLASALVAGWISQRWWKQTHPEILPTPD
jgi:hypothetical protein